MNLKYRIDLKRFYLFIALLPISSAFSQPPDTVVVYEYIYKTDTVWLESKTMRDTNRFERLQPINEALLLIDTTGRTGDLVTFSYGKSATIPIKSIILKDKNKKIKKMKRLTFFGLTLLAMNSSLFAQPSSDKNIGIYVKGYSLKQKAEYAKFLGNGYESLLMYTLQPSLAFGVKGNFPLNSNFTLTPRIGYSQMDGLFNADSQLFRFYFLTSDFLLNYYFLKGENIFGRLYGGLRADCLINQTGGKKLSKVDYSGYSNFVLNYVGGIGLDFRKRIFLEFEYSGNINYFVKNRYMKVNYRTVSINLGCYLFRPGLKY